ncbi:non-ribosomal peptide synthetase [Plantactinospora sp. WMMB782]|uniref:non-ribosomal peptide synthetase n=1 Tax=Plantactinospora sp. WMMB782 TaxID=3404121 RepID=UPI003B956C25
MTTSTAALSPGEQSLWLLHQLAPDLGVANIAVQLRAPTPSRWWPMNESFRWLVRRHDVLRSRFRAGDTGPPVREICAADEVAVALEVFDVAEPELPAALRRYAAAPFDLDRAPLIRLGLFQTDSGQQWYCLAAHHLVVDSTSVTILHDELIGGYFCLAETGEPPHRPPAPPPPPTLPSAESLRFWRERLRGIRNTGMVLDAARPYAAPPTFVGDEVAVILPGHTRDTVAELRRRGRVTDAAVLLTAYLLALRFEGAADDLLVGVMASGVADVPRVGYGVAMLPMRVRVSPESTFDELAKRVSVDLLSAMNHADAPFEALASEVAAVDDPMWWRGGPLRHLFNYHPLPPLPPGMSVEEYDPADRPLRQVHTGLSRFDLELIVEPLPGAHLVMRVAYSAEVHDREFAERLLDRVRLTLEQARACPGLPVGDLDLRTRTEIELLGRMNDTARHWDPPATVPELILGAARRNPEAVAICYDGGEVSYRELIGAAGAVERALREAGAGVGQVVALMGPRGPELAAAVLGIWAAGAAYLPLDPEHPAERLRYQLDDAGCEFIVDTNHRSPEEQPGERDDVLAALYAGRTALRVGRVRGASAAALSDDFDPAAVAYLIYTSGSTGRPKGVRLTHANLANVVRFWMDLVGADRTTTVAWLTTFAFDISALELFLPLAVGGRVVVADAMRMQPDQLVDLLDRSGVTVIQATPTIWRLILPAAGRRLASRTAICGGEPLTPKLARAFVAAGCRAYNAYGPTETTIWSTLASVADEDPDRITVGRPIANTQAYVLDERGKPRAVEVAGELCLAGAGVADGYLRQPELTAERFPTHPVLGRYYRTGDRARILPDGRIELLGRSDRQIKLRAHRIEPAEVEHCLEEYQGVRAAVVVLRGDPTGDGHLAAYVAADDRPDLVASLWQHCRARLPGYCVPSQFVVMDELPQTPNGKLDLSSLVAGGVGMTADPTVPIEVGRHPRRSPGGPAEPPVDAVDERVVEAWRRTLGSAPQDPDANFFLSGASSLQAAQLAAAISTACGIRVTLATVFRAPTPAALTGQIQAATANHRDAAGAA